MTSTLERVLRTHLARGDRQEDLCFALYYPSTGETRLTALLHTALLPGEGERVPHGNAEFLPAYLERVIAAARDAGAGIAFLHSHPARG